MDAAVAAVEPTVPKRPQAGRDAAWLTASSLMTTVLGVLITALLTRSLTQDEYGLWVVLIASFSTLYIAIDLGLPMLLARDVPRGPGEAADLLARARRIQWGVAAVVVPVGWGLTVLAWGEPGWVGTSAVLALGIAGRLLTYAPGATLRGLGEAREEAIGRVIDRAVTAVGLTIVILVGQEAIIVLAAGLTLGPLVALVHQSQRARYSVRAHRGLAGEAIDRPTKQLALEALPYTLTLWIAPLIANLDKFLLGAFRSTAEVAVFNIGWTVFAAGLALPQAVRVALLPSFGAVQGDERLTRARLVESQRLAWWAIPPGIAIGALVVPPLIPLVFGAQYDEAAPVFLLLLVAWGLALLGTPQLVLIQSRSSGWPFARLLVLALVVDLVVGVALIPWLGVIGAAWSTISAQFVLFGLGWWLSAPHRPSSWRIPAAAVGLLVIGVPLAWTDAVTLLSADGMVTWLSVVGLCAIVAGLLGWRPRPPPLTARSEASDADA